jgi:RimJ/RimL family protein N-acetyltransferase
MTPLPEVVEGEGVELRRWTVPGVALLEALVLANLEHLRPFMPWVAEEPLSLVQRRARIAAWEEAWRAGSDAGYAILEPAVAGEVPVGGCGVHRRIGPGGMEIGYWVDHRHLGRGLARRAAAALTRVAFEADGVDHVEIHHDPANGWSRRVPEQLGYALVDEVARERPLAPGEGPTELRWRIDRADWLAR